MVKISRWTMLKAENNKALISKKGFTLIEVMIVLAILAAVLLVGAPRLVRKENNIKTVAHKILILSKEIRNKARLGNATYRLVIDLNEKEPRYWVERANGPVPVDPEAIEKLKEKKDKDGEGPPPLFEVDKNTTKKPVELPSGLRFASVETVSMPAPIKDGIAYIHFFPEGFVESAALQITNGNNLTWTLVFNPLTGQADIVEKAASLKEIQR